MPLPYLLLFDDAVASPPPPIEELALMSMNFIMPSDMVLSGLELTPISLMIIDTDGDLLDIVELMIPTVAIDLPTLNLLAGQMVILTGQLTLEN